MKLLTILNQLCSQKNGRDSSVLKDIRRIFTFNHIPFYDICCGDDNLLPFPVRFNEGILQYFNGTNWVALPATPPPVPIGTFSMFYGLTAGTGNPTSTDYASTVAVKTSVGTGRVPFPRSGPSGIGSAINIDGSSFLLPVIGTYEIIFTVHTTEPGQLQLELNGSDVANSVTSDMNPTSGGHLYVGHVIITTTTVNSILAVINSDGNSTALTITPANGAETHANAQRLIIKQIA